MNWKARSCTWLRRPPVVTLPNQIPETSAAHRFKTEATRPIVKTGSLRIDLNKHARQWAGAISESLHWRAECIQHRHIQVREGSVFGVLQVLAGVDAAAPAASQHQREFVRAVAVTVAERGSEEDHGVVENCGVALLHRLQL